MGNCYFEATNSEIMRENGTKLWATMSLALKASQVYFYSFNWRPKQNPKQNKKNGFEVKAGTCKIWPTRI